jgi:peptidoglycan/LPS O-acetylase OafA/YrhL
MNYKIQIDGLRFFAIISVMIGHWMAWDTEDPFLKNAPWGHGVILFFVISGYLITDILLNQKEKLEKKESTLGRALKVFYTRRFLRIFPIYYLVIFYLYHIDYPKARELFPWLATYTSNIYSSVTNEYAGNFHHFWSLAVEEQFYVLWPLMIFIIPRKHLLKFFVVVMILSFCSRAGCVLLFPGKWMLAAYFTPNLFLPLVLGALLAYIKRQNVVWFYNFFKPAWALIGLLLYSVIFYLFGYKFHTYAYIQILDEYIFAVVATFFVATASIGGFTTLTAWLLENKVVNYIGRISYGVYVYHLFVINFFWDVFTKEAHIGTDSKETARVFYFLICFAIATLSFYIIEKPINSLKNKFKY